MISTYFDILIVPFHTFWLFLWLRLPTSRSACHDCWREKQNHHLIRVVRATQSIILGEMTKLRWFFDIYNSGFNFQIWIVYIYIYIHVYKTITSNVKVVLTDSNYKDLKHYNWIQTRYPIFLDPNSTHIFQSIINIQLTTLVGMPATTIGSKWS